MKGNPLSPVLEALANGGQVGAVLPLLTAVVQRPAWSARYKQVVAVVAALVAGVAAVAADGGWDQFQHGKLTLATFLGVLAAAQTSYDLIWKPSKIAPVIEALTTRKGTQQTE
jgi:peptidoglycan/LPS O-acetylase OafA/YrhL